MTGCFTLVTGGARSGKSSFAEELVIKSNKEAIYIASSQIYDEEMRRRVELHKTRRPSEWLTIEEPYQIDRVIKEFDRRDRIILIDCITVWLSNLLLQAGNLEEDEGQIIVQPGLEEDINLKVGKLGEIAQNASADIVLVTNEVGWGVVPPSPIGRFYRDVAGRANQLLAKKADAVHLVIAGLALQLK